MSEKIATVVLHINPILLRDAKLMAQSLDLEPDRFLTELVEASVASWRLKKAIPTPQQIKEKNKKVH
jgi:hypothetical protein